MSAKLYTVVVLLCVRCGSVNTIETMYSHIQINQINLTDQMETMSTFPEYTIDEIKQLPSSDNVLSVVLNFVE
jgi:hypothetical protein